MSLPHAFIALLRKEIWRFLRMWTQTLLPPVMTTMLYFLIFGQLIGARLGEFLGMSYAQFIAPGLVMMAVINNSYSNVVGSFYATRFNCSVEEMLISPMSNAMILSGFVLAGVLRALLVGGLVSLVAMFFTRISVVNFWLTALVFLLAALVFSLAGFINAIFARSFDDVALIPTFVLTPLLYLGGVFYALDMLPSFWQSLSRLNPILYMVNGFRYGFLGISDVSIWQSLCLLTILVVGLWYWALKLMDTPNRLRQ